MRVNCVNAGAIAAWRRLMVGDRGMRIESDGHSRGNPRLYELIENAPKTGKSPTVWAWPELIDYLKIAGQPVAGPWPPHQEPRPDPDEDTLPVAIPDPGPQQQGPQEALCTRRGSATRHRVRWTRRSPCCAMAATT